WTPLSVDTVAGSHVRSDAAVPQPLQELPVAVRRVGCHRFGRSSLPLGKTGQHILRGHGLLTHPSGCCLYAHDHTAVVVHQIVVVVPQSGRRAALGGIGGIRIGGRYLVLLVNRLLHRVLLFQVHQILTHRTVDLCCFG